MPLLSVVNNAESALRKAHTNALYFSAPIVQRLPFPLQGSLSGLFNSCAKKDFLGNAIDYTAKFDAAVHFENLYKETRAYLESKNYDVALACFDVLTDHKKGKLRKDGVTPDWVHELRQVQMGISLIKAGYVSENDPALGSAELLLCASLTHDLGEDFDVLMSELKNKLREKLGDKVAEKEEMIERVSKSMAILTHDRHMDVAKAKEKFGKKNSEYSELIAAAEQELRKSNDPNKVIRLKELEERIKQDGDYPYPDSNLRIWLSKDPKTGEVIFNHTRYGFENEKGEICIDANSYANSLHQNPYAFLAKILDRIEGLSTRLAIDPYVYEKQDRYLDETFKIFLNDAEMFGEHYKFLDKKLGDAIEAGMALLESLYRANCAVVGNHPDNPKPSNPRAMNGISFSKKLQKAMAGFRFMNKNDHPVQVFSRQFIQAISANNGRLKEAGYEDMPGKIANSVRRAAGAWDSGPILKVV